MKHEKVLLTKLEAESFMSYMRIRSWNNEEAVTRYVQDNELWEDELLPLRNMGLMKFVEVLLNGYKVEETPEERLKKQFDTGISILDNGIEGWRWKSRDNVEAFQDGVRTALNIYGIKVEGVNYDGNEEDTCPAPSTDPLDLIIGG